jgi:hypothetical protein
MCWRNSERVPIRTLPSSSANLSSAKAIGASGAAYQVEIEALWDSNRGGDIRLMAAIDDGGWRAFAPLTDSLIVPPTA